MVKQHTGFITDRECPDVLGSYLSVNNITDHQLTYLGLSHAVLVVRFRRP